MGNRNTLHSRKREIYQVPAAVRVIDILDYLNKNQTASFTEIYSNLNLPKTSAFHILSTLELRGIIRKTAYDGKYSLGLKLYELGNTAVARFDIKKEAIPILKELAIKTNQTAHLGILDGMEGVYLEKIESSRPIQLKSFPGKRISLHSSAIGKVLLAWQPKEIRHKILQTISLPRFTDNTITSRDELVKHLDRVIELGFACDDEENEPDVRCLGAPVWGARNEVIAAISIAGLSSQFTEADRTDMLFHVKEASKKLSMSCAGSGT